MRIHRLTVRNYRIHRDVTVHFDDRLTLITGANETGKSTLLEALHRGLYLKPTAGGNALQQMQSTTHGGAPEVEVVFSTNGEQYTVRKVFSRNAGSILLTADGHANLTGQAAEGRLAELLGIEGLIAANGIEKHALAMSHLWVRQGKAMDDTGEYVPKGNDLLELLQQDGAAGVLMSEADRALTSAIEATVGAIYNQNRTAFLANSEAGRADKALAAARNSYETAAATVARLSSASADLRESEKIARECVTNAATIQQEIHANDINLARISELNHQKVTCEFRLNQANEVVRSLESINQDIANNRTALSSAKAELLPLETQIVGYETSLQGSRIQLASEEAKLASARSTASQKRTRRDFAQHNVTRLDKQRDLSRLELIQSNISKLDESRFSLAEKLNRIATITAANLKKLRALRDQITVSEAELKAVATGILVESAREDVSIDGDTIRVGESRVVTNDTLLAIGSETQIRIRPGGGATLTEKTQAVASHQANLCEQLASLHVGSIEEAELALETRTQIEREINSIDESKRTLLNAEGDLASRLERARRDDADAERSLQDLLTVATPLERIVDYRQAVDMLAVTQQEVAQAEIAERDCQSAFEYAKNAVTRFENDISRRQQELINKRNAVSTQTALLENLISTHGPDDVRTARLLNAEAAVRDARSAVEEIVRSLQDLNPENTELRKRQLADSLSNTTKQLEAANAKINQSKGVLMSTGMEDPEETASLARATLDRAQEEFDRHSKRAKALKLIEDLIQAERANINKAQSLPLTSRIEPYLRTVFGSETAVAVKWDDDSTFSHITIERSSRGEGMTHFTSLSGGAREQAGVAVRLALAELIHRRTGHGQTVILDDTFANSDPERIRQLQTMLFMGAERGLQIVVLTCNSTDYATLGGSRHDLTFARAMRVAAHVPAGVRPQPDLPPADNNETTPGDIQELAARVRELLANEPERRMRRADIGARLGLSTNVLEDTINHMVEANSARCNRGPGSFIALI